jgi:hypothetical protein
MQSLIASVVADANLVPDILSTCELAGITSDNVCTYSAKALAEQLFLTEAEAQSLLELALSPGECPLRPHALHLRQPFRCAQLL